MKCSLPLYLFSYYLIMCSLPQYLFSSHLMKCSLPQFLFSYYLMKCSSPHYIFSSYLIKCSLPQYLFSSYLIKCSLPHYLSFISRHFSRSYGKHIGMWWIEAFGDPYSSGQKASRACQQSYSTGTRQIYYFS